MKYFILIIAILCLSACSLTSPNRYLKKDEIIENKYVSFKAPSTNWETAKEYERKHYTNSQIYLDDYSHKGADFSITVHTDSIDYKPMVLKTNSNYEKINKEYYDSQETKDSHKERGIKYAYSQTLYINGMKCDSQVEAGENILLKNGSTTKWYDIWCGYYDKTEKLNDGKRRLRIAYKLAYSRGNQRLQKDKDTPSNQIKSRDELELILKNEVKKLISTLKIKNFDKEKMIKEGLYHPNKIYKNMKW